MKKYTNFVKLLVFVVLSIIISNQSFSEIVVISSLKSYSHLYQTNSYFFSDIFLEIYGGNKYGGGIVLTPYSSGSLSNLSVSVEKIEFFVNPLSFFKVVYWYGNKEYLGYVSSIQTRFYQIKKDFDFRGWHIIDGTGLSFEFSFFSDVLGVGTYFYRSSTINDGIGSVGIKLYGRHRDMKLTIFSAVSENFIRGGIEFRTFFRYLNASAVIGIDNIPLTNFNIRTENIYALIEEKLNFVSAENSWGFEQIVTFFMKPYVFKGFQRTQDISDIDIRLLLGLYFLKNFLVGTEGIVSLYGMYLPVTQIGISSEAGGFIGFEENNILIKIQPMITILNTTTNQIAPYRISILGELRF